MAAPDFGFLDDRFAKCRRSKAAGKRHDAEGQRNKAEILRLENARRHHKDCEGQDCRDKRAQRRPESTRNGCGGSVLTDMAEQNIVVS
ncbi:hypothetical protein GCM10008012_15000 [Rhizobium anhuiense]|nr:hypothetical protein GCM10008012_15000 [Rhizobium anhuiense]